MTDQFGDFRTQSRQLRGDLSLRRFAALIAYDHALIGRVENGRQRPSLGLAQALDRYAGHGDHFVGLLLDTTGGSRPPADHPNAGSSWEVLDVTRRLRSSELGLGTLDSLESAVVELRRQYPLRSAIELRADALQVLKAITRLRASRMSLAEHRQLLEVAGWTTALLACVNYDEGIEAAGEISHSVTASLAKESGNSELAAWACEIACWIAMTRGRCDDVIAGARSGRALAGNSDVAAQLWAHEARALAGIGDAAGSRRALRSAEAAVEKASEWTGLFTVGPTKIVRYAVDCHRWLGDDAAADENAEIIIHSGYSATGDLVRPMSVAEAWLSQAVTAVRGRRLDVAEARVRSATGSARRCLPALRSLSAEIDRALDEQQVSGALVQRIRDHLAGLRSTAR